ncbi:MAG: IS4 family transposase [Algibacter sp.]|uniref:IS4 family transposase n=1 Tax=Algibacter sp. TaxID=1872428 RepID=UPI0026394D9E|nr:IS4 family transposase [Algibacter sp.]MDG1729184.1 IS4 family transposase [Algibacter sp.]MDG2178441.1 IS4 family transposase [Algibacter sp.]
MKKTNAVTKNSELTSILNTHFQGKLNLARVKLISHFIVALCKVQTVTFEKLANAFDTQASPESSLRRIQRFIANYSLDPDLIARLVFNLLPKQGKLILSIDRTNWKFGQTNINIFMLGIVYKGVAFPLLFTMLDKRGNSNSGERIELVNKFIRLFGKDVIESIVADREFVGEQWLGFLNRNNIRYYIRIRNNFKVFIPHKNKEIKASHLFDRFKPNEFVYYNKIVRVNGQLCYLSGCRLNNRNGKQGFLIIISFNKPEKAQQHYKQRWQIEMSFKAMKSSGFDIEKTHLKDIDRIEKLILLVIIAFVWCYKIGIHLHQINPITIKKHGRKAKSIFKHGLSFLASVLLNTENQMNTNIFHFLSCT